MPQRQKRQFGRICSLQPVRNSFPQVKADCSRLCGGHPDSKLQRAENSRVAGNRYSIYRTYFADGGDEIELYLEEKVGNDG